MARAKKQEETEEKETELIVVKLSATLAELVSALEAARSALHSYVEEALTDVVADFEMQPGMLDDETEDVYVTWHRTLDGKFDVYLTDDGEGTIPTEVYPDRKGLKDAVRVLAAEIAEVTDEFPLFSLHIWGRTDHEINY